MFLLKLDGYGEDVKDFYATIYRNWLIFLGWISEIMLMLFCHCFIRANILITIKTGKIRIAITMNLKFHSIEPFFT